MFVSRKRIGSDVGDGQQTERDQRADQRHDYPVDMFKQVFVYQTSHAHIIAYLSYHVKRRVYI